MHRPNVGDRRGGNPRHERGVLRARYSARRASRVVVAHFFESASDAVYVGASRERTANGRAVALASTGYIAAIDEKRPGRGHVGSARASRVPHSVSRHCPRRQLESRVREAQGRVILLERGLDRSPVAAAGDRL